MYRIPNFQNDSGVLPAQMQCSGPRGHSTVSWKTLAPVNGVLDRVYSPSPWTSFILARLSLAAPTWYARCWQVLQGQEAPGRAGKRGQMWGPNRRVVFALSAISLVCHLLPGRLPIQFCLLCQIFIYFRIHKLKPSPVQANSFVLSSQSRCFLYWLQNNYTENNNRSCRK